MCPTMSKLPISLGFTPGKFFFVSMVTTMTCTYFFTQFLAFFSSYDATKHLMIDNDVLYHCEKSNSKDSVFWAVQNLQIRGSENMNSADFETSNIC
jgi:hypothetical protein